MHSQHLPTFVRLEHRFLCPVCGHLLRDPVQTTCGHRFCQLCIDVHMANMLAMHAAAVTCPMEEASCAPITPDTVSPDFCTKKEINNLMVYCPYRDCGCGEVCEWRKLKSHVSECCHRGDKIPCPLCSAITSAGKMEYHLSKECPQAHVSRSDKCGASFIPSFQQEEHAPVVHAKHMKCEYHRFGCTFQGAEGEVRSHEQSCSAEHLVKLSPVISETEHRLSQASLELHETKERLKASQDRTADLRGDVEQLQSYCERQEASMRELTAFTAAQAEKLAALERRLGEAPKREEYERQGQELRQLKEAVASLSGKVNSSGAGVPGASGLPADLGLQLEGFDRQLNIHGVRLTEADLRLGCLETTGYRGVLVWKLPEYSRRRREAEEGGTRSVYSQPFYTATCGGYKMCARLYPNGDGAGRGTHLSLFFTVMRGECDALLPWPFRQKVTFTLLDQQHRRRHLTDSFRPDGLSSSFRRPVAEMNTAAGCPLFAAHAVADHPPYNVHDTIFIKVAVDLSDLPF